MDTYHKSNPAGRLFLGLVIIFFGVVFFLKALGYDLVIPWNRNVFVGLGLIFLGLSLLVQGKYVSGAFGLLCGLGVIALLMHLLTQGAIWGQFR